MTYETAHTLAVRRLQEQGGVIIKPEAVTVLLMEDRSLYAVVDILVDEGRYDRVVTARLSEEKSVLELLDAMATGSE